MALDEKQSALASRLGIKQRQIGAIEEGDVLPTKEYVETILRLGRQKNPLWFDEKHAARLRDIAANGGSLPEKKEFVSLFSGKSDQELAPIPAQAIVKSLYSLGLDWDDLTRVHEALLSPLGNSKVRELWHEAVKTPPLDLGTQRITFLVDSMRWVRVQQEADVEAFKHLVKTWDGSEQGEKAVPEEMTKPLPQENRRYADGAWQAGDKGSRIRALRLMTGRKAVQLVKIFGDVTSGQISKFENDDAEPPTEYVEKLLALAYQCDDSAQPWLTKEKERILRDLPNCERREQADKLWETGELSGRLRALRLVSNSTMENAGKILSISGSMYNTKEKESGFSNDQAAALWNYFKPLCGVWLTEQKASEMEKRLRRTGKVMLRHRTP